MKAKKQKINTYTHLEKILTLAGLLLIIVGCVANLYGAYANIRFMNNDLLTFIYYFRFIILLGGGFAIGYLFTKKSANRLFAGVSYAVLAIALHWLADLIRISIQSLPGDLSYPWGKIMFFGMPVLAIIATMLIAYFSQRKPRRSDLSAVAKMGIILSFIIYQVYNLANSAYYAITGAATYTPNTPAWLIVGSYFLSPLVIAFASYLLLNNVKKQFNRLFYAVFIGTFYIAFTFVLWEFRTDASHEATNIFSSVVTAVTLLLTAVILWRARKSIK